MTASRLRIVHVVPAFTTGGAGRSIVELAGRWSPAGFEELILSLTPVSYAVNDLANRYGLHVIGAVGRTEACATIQDADLVVIHYWNTPEMWRFLEWHLPPCRVIFWLKILGAHAPQVLTRELVDYADLIIPTTPVSSDLEVVTGSDKLLETVPGIADFERIRPLRQKQCDDPFVVGYVGFVDYVKLHPRFARLCAGIRVPGVRFDIVGAGSAVNDIRVQALALGIADRVHLRGELEDISAALEDMDVFGYPLCHDTYATSEKSLQEAMFAGIPPVVLPHGGIPGIVRDGENGLVAGTEAEYCAAIEYLHREPGERRRLGVAAAADIRLRFAPESAVRRLHQAYDRALTRQKRLHVLPDETAREPHGACGPGFAGSRLFLRSLSHEGARFRESLETLPLPRLLAADAAISRASTVLRNRGGGGLFHYRRVFADDPGLGFWSGLVMLHQRRHALALGELTRASRAGFAHWRADVYRAMAARASGNNELAERLVDGIGDRASTQDIDRCIESMTAVQTA